MTDSELPEYAERVLGVAEQIPPGRVMTYGDVAEWLEEGGPRQVGRVMALYGAAVPWWRVVRADGVLLPGHESRALERYRVEGTPLRDGAAAVDGRLPRVDIRRARWDGAPSASEPRAPTKSEDGLRAPRDEDVPRMPGEQDGRMPGEQDGPGASGEQDGPRAPGEQDGPRIPGGDEGNGV